MEQKPAKKFHGLEIAMDNIRMEEQLIPPGFDLSCFEDGKEEYFKKYGFKVSKLYNQIYQKYNGIASPKYIPASLYFYYITPFLCNLNLFEAYVDKNMYSVLFPDVSQPETIVKNMGNRYFDKDGKELSKLDALEEIANLSEFIIKPSLESGRGRDVSKIVNPSKQEIETALLDYNNNFIVQKCVAQHEVMASLNPTSLNTIRIYTYRPVESDKYVELGSAVRFGGKGAFRDNACTGGGFCKVLENGELQNHVHRYCDFTKYKLEDFGINNKVIVPNFNKAVDLAISLHKRLPYFDLIGWDISIDKNGNPVLIELNHYPDCEFLQIFNGPMFGDYTDDLMEAIKDHQTEFITVARRSFDKGRNFHEYNFQIGKAHSI